MSIFGGRKQQPQSSAVPAPAPSPTPSSAAPVPPLSSRQPVGFETILGANATLKGELRSRANVRLDGIFEGILEIDGNVLVGETAKVTADINAKNVSIAGAVRGNVSGKKVQLLRTSRVWGDISAAAIATEEGAFIDGKITMISHDAAQVFDPTTMPLPSELELPAAPAEIVPEVERDTANEADLASMPTEAEPE